MDNNLPEGFHYVADYQDDEEYDILPDNDSVAIDDDENQLGIENNVDAILESYQDRKTTARSLYTTPTRHDDQNDSRNRIKWLKDMVGYEVPDDFDPHEISWVLPKLGVTGAEGAENAIKQRYFTINVAKELNIATTVTIPIEPNNNTWGQKTENTVLAGLEKIVNTIDMAIDTGQKVVVNCSMGMERSVLATVWYLIRNKNMSLDNAYNFVRSVRPIATDRREWIIE